MIQLDIRGIFLGQGHESLSDNCNPPVNVIIFNNIIGLYIFPRQLAIILI